MGKGGGCNCKEMKSNEGPFRNDGLGDGGWPSLNELRSTGLNGCKVWWLLEKGKKVLQSIDEEVSNDGHWGGLGWGREGL